MTSVVLSNKTNTTALWKGGVDVCDNSAKAIQVSHSLDRGIQGYSLDKEI